MIQPLRVLVAGGSGFIGSHLISFLKATGYEVERLERNPNARYFWDPEMGYLPVEQIEGFDAIINLAGHSLLQGLWTKNQKRKILNSRVESAKLLAGAIDKCKMAPKVFVSASAVGYYGSRGNETLSETDSSGTGFLATVCKEWESYEPQQVRTVFLRTGIVLSPDGGMLQMIRPIFNFGLGGRLGSGDEWMSWIGIEDLVRVIDFAINTEHLFGPVNAVGPNPVTNKVFTKTLAKVLNRPAFMHLPSWLLRAILGELADEMLLASVKALPTKLLQAGFLFKEPDLEQLLALQLKK